MSDKQRELVACVVRYHGQAEPSPAHKVYAALRPSQQRDLRAVVALLRMADRLDIDHRQNVSQVAVKLRGGHVLLRLRLRRASEVLLWAASRGAELFEREFGMPVRLERMTA